MEEEMAAPVRLISPPDGIELILLASGRVRG